MPLSSGVFEGERVGCQRVILYLVSFRNINLDGPTSFSEELETAWRSRSKNERLHFEAQASVLLDVRVICATDTFELFTHGAGGLGTGADFRSNAPDDRNEGSGAQSDQGHTGISAGIMPNIVGNKKTCAETDRDLRKTNDSRDRKVFAKFVQGKL